MSIEPEKSYRVIYTVTAFSSVSLRESQSTLEMCLTWDAKKNFSGLKFSLKNIINISLSFADPLHWCQHESSTLLWACSRHFELGKPLGKENTYASTNTNNIDFWMSFVLLILLFRWWLHCRRILIDSYPTTFVVVSCLKEQAWCIITSLIQHSSSEPVTL